MKSTRFNVMSTVKRRKLVPYSAKYMYVLVNDVSRYPDFIPYCVAANIYDETQEHMTASLTVKMNAGFGQTFTTHNQLVPERSIEMKLANGPFKHLHGFWRFNPVDVNSCTIEIDLSFEFKNKLSQLALSPVFTQVVHAMMDAFIQRAKDLQHD